MNVEDLEVYGDSILIISQSTGKCGVKSLELAKYQIFYSVFFNYLSRSKNQFADALATLSSMLRISEKTDLSPIEVENARPPYVLQ